QRHIPAEIAMDSVVLDGEARAGDVFFFEIRQRRLEIFVPLWIGARYFLRREARLPHAQEPDPVKAHLRQPVQFSARYIIQGRALAEGARQLRHPDTGIDLIERRIARIGHTPKFLLVPQTRYVFTVSNSMYVVSGVRCQARIPATET